MSELIVRDDKFRMSSLPPIAALYPMTNTDNEPNQVLIQAPVPTLYGSASIILATVIGGPFAAAYLVRSNFCRLNSKSNALRHVLAFSVFGVVALYLAMNAPPDAISQFIGSTLPSLFLVGLYLLYLNRFVLIGQLRNTRSLWYAVATGIVVRLAIVGAITIVVRMREVWDVSYAAWLQKNS